MKRAQSAYRKAKASGGASLINKALRPLDETQAFWFVPTSDIWLVDYQTVGNQEEISGFAPVVRSFSVRDEVAVHDQREKPRVNPNILLRRASPLFSNNLKSSMRSRVANGVYDTRKAYLTMSEGTLASNRHSLTRRPSRNECPAFWLLCL